jgi:anaerobic selenocysteine-containing dehydrogenase
MMLIMGGNPAENHPCGFKWAIEAKRRRNAKMIVVDPHVPLLVRIWKGPLKWLGNLAIAAGIVGAAAHYLRFGPKKVEEDKKEEPK